LNNVNELKENEFNLNVPRYVDISEAEEEIDIQTTINKIKKVEKEVQEINIQLRIFRRPKPTSYPVRTQIHTL
jgi:type I restriction enzyme M protein